MYDIYLFERFLFVLLHADDPCSIPYVLPTSQGEFLRSDEGAEVSAETAGGYLERLQIEHVDIEPFVANALGLRPPQGEVGQTRAEGGGTGSNWHDGIQSAAGEIAFTTFYHLFFRLPTPLVVIRSRVPSFVFV